MKPDSLFIPAHHATPQVAAAPQWWAIGLIALAALLTMGALYWVLHTAAAPVAANPAMPDNAPHSQPQQVQAMVDRLAASLEKEPNNGPGWQMLARSYAALGRFTDSAMAYQRAAALHQGDASLLANYADVLAMTQSGNFLGASAQMIRKALELDPRHAKALTLAGTEAFRRNDFQEALRYWHKALEFAPADSELAASVRLGIADAEKRRDGGAADSAR